MTAVAKPQSDNSATLKLDASLVNPFLNGTIETLKIQCSTSVIPTKPFLLGEGTELQFDISSVIGLISRDFKGSIGLCFPKATFLALMGRMFGETYTEINRDLEDGVGELLNIIFGQAKTSLVNQGHPVERAIPTVIRGDNLRVRYLANSPTIILPFKGDCGDFHVEIGINR